MHLDTYRHRNYNYIGCLTCYLNLVQYYLSFLSLCRNLTFFLNNDNLMILHNNKNFLFLLKLLQIVNPNKIIPSENVFSVLIVNSVFNFIKKLSFTFKIKLINKTNTEVYTKTKKMPNFCILWPIYCNRVFVCLTVCFYLSNSKYFL